MPNYQTVLTFPVVKGTVVASTAALVDITPLPTYAVPAGTVTVGDTFKITAYGRYTCGTTATNLTLGVYWGGTAGVALATSGARALTVSQTNVAWMLTYSFTVDSIGTTGTIWGQGEVSLAASATAWTGAPIPAAANAAVTVDTTASKVISIGATLSQVTGAPTATCDRMVIEQLTARS